MSAENALRRLADEHGQIQTAHLPPLVTDRMQEIVDGCVEMCIHVRAALDLPPAALPKLCVQGVPIMFCNQPVCVVDTMQMMKVWRGARIDESCSVCGAPPWKSRYRTVFEDQAAGLSMVGWVCARCVDGLAAWVGVPK